MECASASLSTNGHRGEIAFLPSLGLFLKALMLPFLFYKNHPYLQKE
jgi:hypothetical protein